MTSMIDYSHKDLNLNYFNLLAEHVANNYLMKLENEISYLISL